MHLRLMIVPALLALLPPIAASGASIGGSAGTAPYDVVVDGVDTRTRSFTYTVTDLAIPGEIGPKLALTRAYNSANTGDGPFGRGWTCAFAEVPTPSGKSAVITNVIGQRQTFNGQRQAAAPTLQNVNNAGKSAFVTPTGNLYRYSPHGVERITDRHGGCLVFRYDGGRVSKIEKYHLGDRGRLSLDYSLALK